APDVQGQSADAADHERGAVAGGSLRRDPGDRGRMPARPARAVPSRRGVELLRLDLPVRAKLAAGGAGGGAPRRADHATAVERVPRAPRAGAAALGETLRGGAARLAARTLRTDHAPAGRRSRTPRPLRPAAVPLRVSLRRELDGPVAIDPGTHARDLFD